MASNTILYYLMIFFYFIIMFISLDKGCFDKNSKNCESRRTDYYRMLDDGFSKKFIACINAFFAFLYVN